MKEYVAMVRLCFKYLIRPKEILMLRICDIDFDSGLLRIPPDVSKNHTERTIALGYDVMKYFRELQEVGCNSNCCVRLLTNLTQWETQKEKTHIRHFSWHHYAEEHHCL